MIIYFDDTKNIVMAQHDTLTPIPENMTTEERKLYYEGINLSYVMIPYEIGGAIFDYKVCLNDKGEFVGLEPK